MERWLKIFKALGDETRLKIIALLHQNGFCVGALARIIGISEASVSAHIRILRQTGLLIGEKRGGYTFYQINEELVDIMVAEIGDIMAAKTERKECCHHMTGNHQFCKIYTGK